MIQNTSRKRTGKHSSVSPRPVNHTENCKVSLVKGAPRRSKQSDAPKRFAGRYGEPTKVIRVPVSLLPIVEILLNSYEQRKKQPLIKEMLLSTANMVSQT